MTTFFAVNDKVKLNLTGKRNICLAYRTHKLYFYKHVYDNYKDAIGIVDEMTTGICQAIRSCEVVGG